jgi:acetylornithine deacetylase/succinyl-diaminopimelate desuccinylase-like protein
MSSSLDVVRGAGVAYGALRAEVAALLKRLVTCDTSNPPGRESQAAAVIEDHLRGTGLACRRIAKDPDRANLLVRLPGTGSGNVIRKAYGSIAYGFIPVRHADPMVNLTTKHGADERVLLDDLLFQTRAALSVARSIGELAR